MLFSRSKIKGFFGLVDLAIEGVFFFEKKGEIRVFFILFSGFDSIFPCQHVCTHVCACVSLLQHGIMFVHRLLSIHEVNSRTPHNF